MLNNIISDRSSLDLRDFPTVAQVLNSLTQEEKIVNEPKSLK